MSTVELDRLPRLGGVLCLDFVNTIDPRHGPRRIDYLPDYSALVEWAVWAEVLVREEGGILLRSAARDQASAEAVLRRAHLLRDTLHTLLAPDTRHQPAEPALAVFNRELQAAMRHAVIVMADDGYEASWLPVNALDRVLWPVARSAAELMESRSLRRLRECQGRDCGWLFLDTSKAGRRRWCSMAVCGNRAKSQRHRRRLAERTRPGAPGDVKKASRRN